MLLNNLEISTLAWTQFWQVTVLIGVVAGLVRLTARDRPHLAHLLRLLVILKCLTPPLQSSPVGLFCRTPSLAALPAASPSIRLPEPDPIVRTDDLPTVSEAALTDHRGHVEERRPADTLVSSTPLISPQPVQDRRPSLDLASGLLALWGMGALLVGGTALARGTMCLRAARRAARPVPPDVEALLPSLSERLGLRRRVRLVVTAEAIGPAVAGVFRPTVYLPETLVRRLSVEALEPILAHELIHVRRGDLLVGWLQTAAQAVWWFHPLVWRTNRQVSREAERCCDEEVIAGLRCRPATYAHGLLDVLELSRGLRPIPSAPGVRAADLTRKRLERIMRLSQDGASARTPRWCWGLFLISAAVVLPGATRPDASDDEDRPEVGAIRSGLASLARSAQPQEAASSDVRVTSLVSPDGRREAHNLVVIGPDGEQTSKIVVANIDGSDRRALDIALDDRVDVYWFGNDRLAYAPDDEKNGYHVITLDGKSQKTLPMPEGSNITTKQLSPDGRQVAFRGRFAAPVPVDLPVVGEKSVQSGLFVLDLATGKVRPVLDEAVMTMPAWSHDSKKLAIGAAGGYVAKYPLTIVDIETGKAEPVGCDGVGAAWSPDGRFLAFTTEVVRGGSWLAGIPLDGRIGVWDLERKALTVVSPPAINRRDPKTDRWEMSGSYRPVWSPDGRRLSYQFVRSDRGPDVDESQEETWVVNRDGTGARKVLNHRAEVAWLPDGQTLLWLKDGRVGRVVLDGQADLGPTPARPIGEFSVVGTVTDDQGRPVPGVSIHVSRGWGTLFSTHPVLTDAQGRYEVHFGPGMHTSDGVSFQCAIVHASKPGYYEKDLCRAGNLGMAYKKSAGADQTSGFVGVVYPGHPYRVDFTMRPAARLKARLVDPEGKPLAKYRVSLEGDLYPASSVLAQEITDAQGVFGHEEVPLRPYRFRIGHGRGSAIASDPLPFTKPGDYEVVVTYQPLDAQLSWKIVSQP